MINLKKVRLFGVAILLFQSIFGMGHVAFADSSNRVTTIAENANLRKTPADLLALLGSYMEKSAGASIVPMSPVCSQPSG